MSDIDFVVVVPAKPLAHGKSRLVGIPDEQRRALAQAFLHDTVHAAVATHGVSAVLVVTDDFRLAATLRGVCAVIPDGVSGDLNGTLRLAAAEAGRRWPGTRPVALCADLPALTPEALGAVLDEVRTHAPASPAFVADRLGTGTTLYTAPSEEFRPRFGERSAQRHRDAGAVALSAGPQVSHDVDDMADLGRAMVLGLGPRTAQASGRA
jgi:2-phospho-L-lactate/phosphoenolpyruvate guanylyltransferase